MRKCLIAVAVLALHACQVAGEPEGDAAPIEVAADDLTYCEVIEARATAIDCELAEAADSQAQTGLADLKYPARMVKDRPSTVRLVVSRVVVPPDATPPPPATDEAPTDVSEAAPSTAESDQGETASPPEPRPDVRITYHPMVGRLNSARLESTDFEITPTEAVTKEIPKGGQEVWTWQVTPLRDGLLTFVVVTNVQFRRTDGTVVSLAPRVTEYEVTAGVGWTGVLRAWLEGAPGWIKLITAVIVALTALATAVWGFRKALSGRGPPTNAEPKD